MLSEPKKKNANPLYENLIFGLEKISHLSQGIFLCGRCKCLNSLIKLEKIYKHNSIILIQALQVPIVDRPQVGTYASFFYIPYTQYAYTTKIPTRTPYI